MWSGSGLLHLMTCVCVCMCVNNDTLIYFHFSWWESDGAVTFFVEWLSAVQSHIHTNVFPFFPLCRAHWDTWDKSGGDDCFVHQPESNREGGARDKAKHQPVLQKKTTTKQALTALSHQERGSSSQVHALTFERWKTSGHSCHAGHCPCETEERGSAVL